MTMVCFVPFSDQSNFHQERFLQAATRLQKLGWSISNVSAESESIYALNCRRVDGGHGESSTVFVSKMPALPEDACEERSPLWITAPEDLRNHQSHWIVTTALSETSLLDQAILLTELTAAILQSHPKALGVLWHKHALKTDRNHFLAILDSLTGNELPTSLWIRVAVVPPTGPPDPKRLALTTGMDGFDLMEIETKGSNEPGEELYARIDGMCDYLLRNGPILNHGDTIGESVHERLLIRHGPSSFGRAGDVIHLIYGDNDVSGSSDRPDRGSGLTSILMLCGLLTAVGLGIYGIARLTSFAYTAFTETADPASPIMTANPASDSPARSEVNQGGARQDRSLPLRSATQPKPPVQEPPVQSSGPAPVPSAPRALPRSEDKGQSTDGSKPAAILRDSDPGSPKTTGPENPLSNPPPTPPPQSIRPKDQGDSSGATKADVTPHAPLHDRDANVGDSLEIKWGNKWWKGKIIGISGQRFQVSYDGWSDRWNEWKTAEALRWPTQETEPE